MSSLIYIRSLRDKQSLLNHLKNYTASDIITGTTDAAYRWGKDQSGNKLVGFLSGAVAFCGFTALSIAAGPTTINDINERKKIEEEIFWIKKKIKNIEKNDGRIFRAPAQLSGSSLVSHTPKALISNTDQNNVGSNKSVNTNTKAEGKDSESKAITIQQLKKIEYQELNFEGSWLSFIGYPSIIFFTVIFGKAGEGKSTFAILFADYLSTHFGRVLYISGEEGFAKTFKDKIERLEVNANDLYVVDSRSIEDIKAELETRHYNFVFIDSLDTLGMGPQEMKDLRQLYPDIAFITISQSTKDGKMRGSNELIHDCDVVIQVTDGVAVTTKNRFLERGQEFKVF